MLHLNLLISRRNSLRLKSLLLNKKSKRTLYLWLLLVFLIIPKHLYLLIHGDLLNYLNRLHKKFNSLKIHLWLLAMLKLWLTWLSMMQISSLRDIRFLLHQERTTLINYRICTEMQMPNKWTYKFKLFVKILLSTLTPLYGSRTLQTTTSTLRTDLIKTKWPGGELAWTIWCNVNAMKLESKSSTHICHNTMKRLRHNSTLGVFIEWNLDVIYNIFKFFLIFFHFTMS